MVVDAVLGQLFSGPFTLFQGKKQGIRQIYLWSWSPAVVEPSAGGPERSPNSISIREVIREADQESR